jgi:hypothetical protein
VRVTFLEQLMRKWFPSSRVEVRMLPAGGIEARVRYSEKDWAWYTTAHDEAIGAVRELVPIERPRRRRLHWGRRR